MRRYCFNAFLFLSALAASEILLPLSVQGMQELPAVPLSDQEGPNHLGPENKRVPDGAPMAPPVPALVGADAAGVDEAEPMLRGPVHEAFAEQFNQDPVQGQIVPKQPPEPIEELPPDVRPEGRQVEWISGYWAWDDDDQDFFWVSGIWREVPQGFRWLPGYWTKADTGYQWVSGTWIPEQTEEIQYVETAPPESLELGPVGIAPSQEHIWIPGCWNWNISRYAWRPGYWSMGYSNWIWIPARHVWTPRGYFYGNGYWDYPVNRRGLLFAPYRFRRAAYWNRSRGFTPQVVIAINQLHWNLWVRPRSGHYYFGDYYGPRYANSGFQPWHQFHRQRRQFDPLYSHFSRSAGVGNESFYDQVNGRFNLLTSQVDRRPARTFNHREERERSRLNSMDDRSPLLGSTIQQHIKEAGNTRFVKLQDDQRIRLQSDSKSVRQLVDQRRDVENRGRLESTRPGHETNDSVGRILNADRHDAERRNKTSGSETRPSERRSDVAKSVTPKPSGEGDRSDRLRLPPVVRQGKDNKGLSNTGPSSNVKASESGAPGSPVTRGERPRGLDPVSNRERTPANSNTVDAPNINSRDSIRDRAARTGAKPDNPSGVNNPQEAKDLKPITKNRRDVDNLSEAPRRSNGRSESSPDTGRLRDNSLSPKAQSGNAVDASKARASGAERSPRAQTGNAADASKARARGAERSNARPSVTSPPIRAEREARPPAARTSGSDGVPRRIDNGGRPQNESRPTPPSRPAVEKPRRTESAPATRPPRVQTNPGAGSGERRKKK